MLIYPKLLAQKYGTPWIHKTYTQYIWDFIKFSHYVYLGIFIKKITKKRFAALISQLILIMFIFFFCSLMFWTNHRLTPKLESAELDGTNHMVIRTEGLGRPRTLTADYRSERIYWFSPELSEHIMSVSIDGEKTERKKIVSRRTSLWYPKVSTSMCIWANSKSSNENSDGY